MNKIMDEVARVVYKAKHALKKHSPEVFSSTLKVNTVVDLNNFEFVDDEFIKSQAIKRRKRKFNGDSNMNKLSIQDRINFLQRFIIVHSYIYYELNDNAISDKDYDAKARELVKYKNEHPELWKTSEYYKQFGDDYNGSTGFTLYHDLDEKQKMMIRVIAGMRNRY